MSAGEATGVKEGAWDELVEGGQDAIGDAALLGLSGADRTYLLAD